ncbi:protein-L-isoaspartate O-methyltransferase [Thiohalobacter sp. COW1]|uniref:Protein-L-isoaspartate O-methyltransferase n=1 Tax=Thiohalobacter thiocyanaticus TaxID=585455 RepID=A0A1Z4VT28_9GAMM|nr:MULTISPECIES: protein-L-isoaspartate(D-aspartate) O-methyltransferase [Thiohalobacter]BAZ94625.1 protein-L-isoaspartate O-methyltransferase [Thiohalobacter thiocyanaticus]BCO30306.1 protein-L-isoaspartate O-methyltransferase [Thiohalobacter sp. COW1]
MTDTALNQARARLLREIEQEFAYTGAMTGCPQLDPRVRAALEAVPREHFIPAHLRHQAYGNHPLPIGDGQTISQPYIVALMSQCLALTPHSRVLEIGTGSGYQAAILARLAAQVYSVETVAALGRLAQERLQALGLDNVHTRIGNGRLGWPEAAPFDGVMITAACERVPPALLEQLAPAGRLIAPIGGTFSQELMLYRKAADGRISSEDLLPVMFVPLVDRDGGEPQGAAADD